MRALLRFEGGREVPLEDTPDGDIIAHIQPFHGETAVSEPMAVPFKWNFKMEIVIKPSEPLTVDSTTLTVPVIGVRRQAFKPITINPPDELTICWEIR